MPSDLDLPDEIYGFGGWLLWMIGTRAPALVNKLYDEGPANSPQAWADDRHRVPTPSVVAWLLLAAERGLQPDQLPRKDPELKKRQASLRAMVSRALGENPRQFKDKWLRNLAVLCQFSDADLNFLLANRHDTYRDERERAEQPAMLRKAIRDTLAASAPEPERQPAPSAPRTLPPETRSFTGRNAQLSQLAAAAAASILDSGGVVSICAIGGLAGVGKSRLATHAAHQLAPQFPGGQFYLPLHGHTPGQRRVSAAEALASLLQMAGFAAGRIPAAQDARSGLWRDYLAGKRILLLLDDVAEAEQVRPLLPGTPGSLVLITSRQYLSGLEGAISLSLDILPAPEAARLLTELSARPDLDPGDPAVGQLTELSGCLPLAIELLARRLHNHPAWTAGDLAAELAAAQDRLDLMRAGDRSVLAAFDLSYADLTPDQQRLFRRLGLHPGTEFDVCAAAALDGAGLAETRRCLEALYEQYLLTEQAPGRYSMHDLIRQHAVGKAMQDPPTEGDAAIARLTDYYLRCATAADAALTRQSRTRPVVVTSALPFALPDLSDGGRALSWFRTERRNLLACLDRARDAGQHSLVVALTASLAALLRQDGPWADALARHSAAIETARQAGDKLGEANARCDLADIRYLTGDYPGAAEVQREALEIYRGLGDELGLANALTDLGIVHEHRGQYSDAVRALDEALEIYRVRGDRLGQAQALSNLAVVREHLNQFIAAAEALDKAQVIYRDLGLRQGQADTLIYLGSVLRITGRYASAAEALQEALTIHHTLGRRLGEANALTLLGAVRERTGDGGKAATLLNRALDIYTELGQRLGQANAQTFLSMVAERAGDYGRAEPMLQSSLAVYRDLGDRGGEAQAQNVLGNVQRLSGHVHAAADSHRQALALAEEIQSRWDAGHAHWGLGRCASACGNLAVARQRLCRAQQIFGELGTPEADEVEAELRDLSRRADAPHPAD
jgi:tetratricopeptide (TPR) repeat protein